MAPFLEDLAAALVEDEYEGVISLESVYRPTGGTFEEGFLASVDRFKEIFGCVGPDGLPTGSQTGIESARLCFTLP